jgi:predicted kinase
MLDALLRTGSAPADLADRLAIRLIRFHRDVAAPCDGESDADALATAVVTENLDQLEPFAGTPLAPLQLDMVSRGMRRFVAERRELLRARAAAGWIREGHGDLRAEHVCLEPDGAVQVYDCVEFSRAIRCADVASDLGFLLLDLDRLGARAVSRALLDRYRAAGFDLPDELVRFYKAHRALVRAKVACLERAALPAARGEALAAEAADYLNLATAAALPARPVLVAMTGLSGTGKSSVAAALGRALDAPVHSSDAVRKELANLAATAPAAAPWQQGIYAPERTRATYDRLLELAVADLAAGRRIVLDASFLSAAERQRLAAVAAETGVPLLLVETVAEETVAVRRIRDRAARGGSPSDATEEIYRRQRATLAVPQAIPAGAIHVQVDTSTDGPVDLDPVLRALNETGLLAASPAETAGGDEGPSNRAVTIL